MKAEAGFSGRLLARPIGRSNGNRKRLCRSPSSGKLEFLPHWVFSVPNPCRIGNSAGSGLGTLRASSKRSLFQTCSPHFGFSTARAFFLNMAARWTLLVLLGFLPKPLSIPPHPYRKQNLLSKSESSSRTIAELPRLPLALRPVSRPPAWRYNMSF